MPLFGQPPQVSAGAIIYHTPGALSVAGHAPVVGTAQAPKPRGHVVRVPARQKTFSAGERPAPTAAKPRTPLPVHGRQHPSAPRRPVARVGARRRVLPA